ncbi:MAG: TrkH family potassium uptake protein [Verrucomicrobia bacterium]|nr:MAG: TrkH family potassium uptake protein [Verrucomicrobiota bacterium]
MNYSLVLRLLSAILFALAIAFVGCLAVALVYSGQPGEERAVRGFALSILLSSGIGLGFYLFGRKGPSRFFQKEALCVIGVGWILASLIGALPYGIIVEGISPVDAFFESASGLTTTGASIFSDVESLPKSLLFWRSLSQWIGGMGVVVFFVAILGFLGAGGRILYANESSGFTADFVESRVQSAVKNLWMLYLGLSAVCTLVYRIGGMGWYDAICHMFTTLSTGGFSTHNASMAAFESPFLEWAATAFMVIGGTSFLLILQVLRGRFKQVRLNTEFHAYTFILLVSTLAVTLFLMRDGLAVSWSQGVRASAFQVASIMTTTGFSTENFGAWSPFPKVVLLTLMIVGGCSASTAGGLKVIRLVVGIRSSLNSIERAFRSRVVRRIVVNGRTLEDESAQSIMTYIVILGLICLVCIPLTAVFEPEISVDGNISAVFACLFNIGPGLAEVGPARNYADFHDYTKVLLSLLMVMGRLELYAILVLFSPSLWRRFS